MNGRNSIFRNVIDIFHLGKIQFIFSNTYIYTTQHMNINDKYHLSKSCDFRYT